MQKEYYGEEQLSFKDTATQEQHGLHGVVQIYRRNKETGEVSFWDESHNIIPISGYQFILMKLFNLFLDSSHGKVTDNLTKDTTLAIPDLNEKLQIGTKPSEYSVMDDNISVNSFCQGFMIGNGGASADSVTTKNTAYSYTSLRNPIPFQQSTTLDTTIAGKYLGLYHGNADSEQIAQSAYIKKFDETPHIYHSWWVDGQRWDYVDPVTQNDLGPDAINGTPKTNRIETYVECKLSLSDTDCKSYFDHSGNTQTPMINELGLVAFDTVPGTRSIMENCYSQLIVPFLKLVYRTKVHTATETNIDTDDVGKIHTSKEKETIITLIKEICNVLGEIVPKTGFDQFNISSFYNQTYAVSETLSNTDNLSDTDFEECCDYLRSAYNLSIEDGGLAVQAYYNQNGDLQYVEDTFLACLQDSTTSNLTVDEAQRIKLITYYTFNSIPISENWEILINYRIYAN